MGVGLLILFVVIILVIVFHTTTMEVFYEQLMRPQTLTLYDNSNVPKLSPPDEIIIEENELVCHSTPLTPCFTNGECQLCREGRAACVLFEDHVTLELNDETTIDIVAGSRYCLALSSKQARSCNPHTGTWVMRQIDSSNFSLICHCDYPGLVTQTTVYEDCDVSVGCRPYGVIASVYETPMRCICDAGYVSEIAENGTPYCRPMVLRDVRQNPEFFARPPCQDGFIESNHPALRSTYHQQIGVTVCIPDPCSIDPVTGLTTGGRVYYEPPDGDTPAVVMCACSHDYNIFPVFSLTSMLNQSSNTYQLPNYCIQPTQISRQFVHADMKFFWARDNPTADADIIMQMNSNTPTGRYRNLLVLRTEDRPPGFGLNESDRESDILNTTNYLLKFSICSVFNLNQTDRLDVYQRYCRLESNPESYYTTCVLSGPQPAQQNCRYTNPFAFRGCIMEEVTNPQRDCRLTLNPVTSNLQEDRVLRVGVWNRPSYYSSGEVPLMFYISTKYSDPEAVDDRRGNRTLRQVWTRDVLPESQYTIINVVLESYRFYSKL
jgi:hypothetical protein